MSDTPAVSDPTGTGDRLGALLRDTRAAVARPDNRFDRSSWEGTAEAVEELDLLIAAAAADSRAARRASMLFLPTGPLQEVALGSGWGDEFLQLADRYDEVAAAIEAAQATPPGTFPCRACARECATFELIAANDGNHGGADSGVLRRSTFTGVLTQPMSAAALAAVRLMIDAGDAGALHAFDPELAPFWCPECDASFCGEHWARWDVFDDDDPSFHDSIRGRCPHGHERMLED